MRAAEVQITTNTKPAPGVLLSCGNAVDGGFVAAYVTSPATYLLVLKPEVSPTPSVLEIYKTDGTLEDDANNSITSNRIGLATQGGGGASAEVSGSLVTSSENWSQDWSAVISAQSITQDFCGNAL